MLSHVGLCNPMQMPSSPVLHYLPKFGQIHVHWVSDATQSSYTLPSPSPFVLNLSQYQGHFQWVGSSHHIAEVWSFSFSISHSNEYSGLISFRIDWFDLLAVQGTLESLLQHHSSKAAILQCLAVFMVPFMVTLTSVHDYWKNHSFDYLDLCQQSGPLSLLFNTLSRFVIAFLPRGKHLLISWLQSLSSDFGAQENKVCHCFHFSPSICYEVMGPDAVILVFSVLSFFTLFFHQHQEAL